MRGVEGVLVVYAGLELVLPCALLTVCYGCFIAVKKPISLRGTPAVESGLEL